MQQTPKPKSNPKQAYQRSIFSTVVLLQQEKNEVWSFHLSSAYAKVTPKSQHRFPQLI
jgi:hypothetical protein